MGKNVIKINESTIKQIVAESVKKVLNEGKKEDFKKYFIYVCKSGMSIQSLLNKVVQILGYESLFKLVEGIYSEISDYDPSNYPEI